MGPLDFYRKRFEIENNLTRNVLKAIPPDKLGYRPHERSPSTGQVAWTIVRGLYVRINMVSHCASEVILDPHPSLAQILKRFEVRLAGTTHNWSPFRRNYGQESAGYASAIVLL